MNERLEANKKQLLGIPWWLIVRKETTPVHWLFGGVLCWGMALAFGLASAFFMQGFFMLDEKWNDHDDIANGYTKLYSGCADWWENWLMFCVAAVPIIFLQCFGVVHIGWFHGGIV
jgi:hypothetical protein